MPTKKYALEAGGQPRVEVSWGMSFRNVVVKVDGMEAGRVPDQKQLRQGADFPLADGSTLRVQLVQKFIQPELQVTRNGEPLPGSASDPRSVTMNAASILYFIAILNIVLGGVAMSMDVEFLDKMGVGLGSLIEGVIYLVLAILVHKRQSLVALWIGIVLFLLDTLLTLAAMVQNGGGVGGVVARVFFIIALFRGAAALKQMRSQSATISGPGVAPQAPARRPPNTI